MPGLRVLQRPQYRNVAAPPLLLLSTSTFPPLSLPLPVLSLPLLLLLSSLSISAVHGLRWVRWLGAWLASPHLTLHLCRALDIQLFGSCSSAARRWLSMFRRVGHSPSLFELDVGVLCFQLINVAFGFEWVHSIGFAVSQR